MTRIRQLVGTRRGMASWAGQSLTALIMIVGLVYLVVSFVSAAPSGYRGLVEFIGADYFRVPASITAVALIWHAWLGTKSIIMDYIKWPWYRVVKYIGSIIYFIACLVWFLGVIWGL